MPLPIIFSLIFFTAFSIYFFFGFYILSLNFNSPTHRTFFYLCLALCIWAFSFSISNSAPEAEVSLFWRRVAVFGWGFFSSFFLVFVLFLTEKAGLLKKKWAYLFILMPGALNVIVFGLYGEIAIQQYQLANTYAGWVNIAPASIWDRLYQLQYMTFTLTGIGLTWQWGSSSKEPAKRKQTYLIVFSFATALLIGTLTEYIINLYSAYRVPQLAPVIILIPISVIFYCIKKYGFMTPEVKNREADEVQILSDITRARLYQFITKAFVAGAFLYFATQYLIYQAPLKSVAGFCGLILLDALWIAVIQRLQIRTTVKEALLGASLAIMIPLILLVAFIDTAGTTAWSICFILVILSVAFGNKWMLMMVGATTFITLILVWAIRPEQPVTISSADHLARIVIFGFFLWAAFYINRIFFQRLVEKQEQVEHQRLLSQASANFANANEDNFDEKIDEVLKLLGEHFEVDRAHLTIFSDHPKASNYTYEWRYDGVGSIKDIAAHLTIADFPPWVDLRRSGFENGAHIPEAAASPDASLDTIWLQDKQLESSFVAETSVRTSSARTSSARTCSGRIPLIDKEKVMGFFGFDALRGVKNLSPEDLEILKVIANRMLDLWLKIDAENKIAHMAYHDALTGLPNRLLIEDRMEQAIQQAVRTGKQVEVAFIDIDNLKAINDTMGHDSGDALLIQVSNRLCACLRPYDTVARFGGDEFLVMATEISQPANARKVAEKIMSAFHEPLIIKDQECYISASMGVAVFPLDGETPKELIKHADLAMYASKEQGKNRYTFCSADIKEEFLINLELSNSLCRALERDDLVLYYQPKVKTVTGEIAGVEALIRWRHPLKGIIAPSQFIPIAEKNGLINPIGQWVLQTACRQNKAWQERGLPAIRMAVNLSLGQFLNKKLVGNVTGILEETGLNPADLELEVTESIAIDEPEYIIRTLDELKALGISISIDDFGTQYSSLSRLKNLPIDRIKIDMLFVRGITKGSKQEGIIKTIFQLAKTLDLKVTAEGVETDQQLAFLREIACDEIQGYYYYKPMPLEEVEAILVRQQEAVRLEVSYRQMPNKPAGVE